MNIENNIDIEKKKKLSRTSICCVSTSN